MASDLYETLGIARDATPEQIRKAYKKKALQTHPDRLPPNATQSEKVASEEQFRKVNNAYEVLINDDNRKVYDRHGVWPPPEPEHEELPPRGGPSRHSSHHFYHSSPIGGFPDPFEDPFFRRPFHNFAFTDPFVLFESVFGDLHRDFGMPRHSHPYEPQPHRYEPDNPFERIHRLHNNMVSSFMSDIDNDMFGMFSGFPGRPRFASIADSPAFGRSGNGMQWASESHMVTTVNGVTQSIHKRRDWDGNTHVTRTLPNGREIHTINGVEQPSASTPSLPYYNNDRGQLPPPPPVGQIHSTGGSHHPQNTPPPPYPGHTSDHHHRRHHSRHHDRRHSDTRPVIPGTYTDHGGAPVIPEGYDRPNEEHHSRKRWWGSGW